MFPAKIKEYQRPKDVSEAVAAIARSDLGDVMFLAGGQSAMQAIKSRMLKPDCIVDLQSVAELRGVSNDAGVVEIGAMTRYVDLMDHAALGGALGAISDAATHVGDRQVRNRGTIGGSVCWNYVAACMPTAVLALAGECQLASAHGTRSVAADEFFLGPLTTAKTDTELLTSVRFAAPAKGSGSAYKKWGLVADALPVVGVAVNVTLGADGLCTQARVALAGLPDGAQRAPSAEEALIGTDGSADAISAAMAATADAVETQSDSNASAEYRRQLIRSLGAEVAQTAFARAAA